MPGSREEFTPVSSECNITEESSYPSEGNPVGARSEMRLVVTVVLFLAWITAYFAGVLWISRHYRDRALAHGHLGRHEYRADKDPGLRLALFALGVLLFLAAYLITSVIG